MCGEQCCRWPDCIPPAGPDDQGPDIHPPAWRTIAGLGPCCRRRGPALLLSERTCEAPVTDGGDILPYLLPLRVTCNMYSFIQTTVERRQLSTPLSPRRPASAHTHTSPTARSRRVWEHPWRINRIITPTINIKIIRLLFLLLHGIKYSFYWFFFFEKYVC